MAATSARDRSSVGTRCHHGELRLTAGDRANRVTLAGPSLGVKEREFITTLYHKSFYFRETKINNHPYLSSE